MRTLCLNLQPQQSHEDFSFSPAAASNKSIKSSVAENFLTFSPRVQFRDPGFVFVEISSTAPLFGGESALLNEALRVSHEFFPEAQAAISNSPAAAQVFSLLKKPEVIPPSEEARELGQLPLSALIQLEGLVAWRSMREVENIVDFFNVLGFRQLNEVQQFQVESFRERWGDTGAVIWKRLHGLDRQVISPLQPTDLLIEYVHLDHPVSLLAFLLHCLEKSLRSLLARLQGRGEFARRLRLHLYCEYSDQYHLVELTPASPNRDFELFMKLMENKLATLELENPIRQFELEVIPCPEKIQQLDFWQPRIKEGEKLQQLISVFQQSSITSGFLKPHDEIWPEKSWSVTSDFEDYEPLDDDVEFMDLPEAARKAFQIRPAYSRQLVDSPRPTVLLEHPQPLSEHELQRLHFLSPSPIERLEDGWWEGSRGRDYFFALSPQGENLWVFYDKVENRYYLHGYFD